MILFLFDHSTQAQGRKGFETVYYPATRDLLPSLSTKLFYQANNGWYGELRYNYEEQQAVACSAGKTFFKENTFSYSFTPIVGLVAGTLQGITTGLNTSLTYKGITFTSFLQHASCFESKPTHFLYSWSELGCQLTKRLSAGLVLQQTCIYHTGNHWEPGLQLTISFARWTFPLYLFKPADTPGYFAMGVVHDWKTN